VGLGPRNIDAAKIKIKICCDRANKSKTSAVTRAAALNINKLFCKASFRACVLKKKEKETLVKH
jgi:hypothetical protein